jgi:hypothetical protein
MERSPSTAPDPIEGRKMIGGSEALYPVEGVVCALIDSEFYGDDYNRQECITLSGDYELRAISFGHRDRLTEIAQFLNELKKSAKAQ